MGWISCAILPKAMQPARLPLQEAEFAAEDSGRYTNCKVLARVWRPDFTLAPL
jgi:hypothetical protein